MKEDFLHYVWKFQKFDSRKLTTTKGQTLQILQVGEHNQNSGPDFFNSQIRIDAQLWVGNVEIHIRSSHWYVHTHEEDAAYDNVILHVVWEHDAEIFRKNESVIPTLELKSLIFSDVLDRYQSLFSQKHKWINCEDNFSEVENFTLQNWLSRMYFERLEIKSQFIFEELKTTGNNWEALLFRLLCKNFGQKINGASFLSVARSIEFTVIQKCRHDPILLEALLFGQAGLLHAMKEDAYYISLQKQYEYLKRKFQINKTAVTDARFFRLRPSNFPTLRLSQLSVLYSEKKHLFSEIISSKTYDELKKIFSVSATENWKSHYNFGTPSTIREKKLSEKMIDLLIINTVIPLKFCYDKHLGKDVVEEITCLAQSISPEKNSIIDKFHGLYPFTKYAFETQALLQLKNEYCSKNRCLECAVGNAVLKA